MGFFDGLFDKAAGFSIFGSQEDPYADAMEQYLKYAEQSRQYQQPFHDAGVNAIGGYQNWLNGMSNPTQYMNNMMGQYQESPWAKYQQQQAMRANQNYGSATGLSGSTPMQLQAQQNSRDISSQDMNQWMQNVMGINTQYGTGQQNLMSLGANSANQLSDLYNGMGGRMGAGAYGSSANSNQNMWNIIAAMGMMV